MSSMQARIMVCAAALSMMDAPGARAGGHLSFGLVAGLLIASLVELLCVSGNGDLAWVLLLPVLVSASISAALCVGRVAN
jgi:hypothetical protein